MWSLEIIQKKNGTSGYTYETSVVLERVCLEQACIIMEAFAVGGIETRFELTRMKED